MASITVKGIPDELYEKLKAAAASNRRSVNGEIISLIERSLTARRVSAQELIGRLSRLHRSFGDRTLELGQLERARREGRP